MKKRLNFVAALGLAVTFAMPVQGQDANTVVATVNGKYITLGHMIVARAILRVFYNGFSSARSQSVYNIQYPFRKSCFVTNFS